MGFTRYWIRPRELDLRRFADFVHDCEKFCIGNGEFVSKAYFGPEEVRFDGDPGCEPFIVARISSGRERDGRITEFCKTQGLPYDDLVAQCLLTLQTHFPEVEIPMAT
jgi:hypothetical protein